MARKLIGGKKTFFSKLTKSPKSWVNAVGSVGGSHNNDVSPLLQSVHQGEQLRHDAPLYLTMSLRRQRQIRLLHQKNVHCTIQKPSPL